MRLPMGEPEMAEKIVFKKYANRRLYNTDKSEYVTLKEVADLVRQGTRVEVIDAKTKEDVTAFILTQIVLEAAKQDNTLLPVPILHMIIQYGDNLLGEFFSKYFQKSIQNYVDYKATVENQYDKWLDLGKDASGMAQQSMESMKSFQTLFEQFFSTDKKPD
jgi:polyhydroxyalkanoate synthesis repressor PhaR